MEKPENKFRWHDRNDTRDFSFETYSFPEQTWRGLTSLAQIAWYFGKEAILSVSNFGSATYLSFTNYIGNKLRFRGK